MPEDKQSMVLFLYLGVTQPNNHDEDSTFVDRICPMSKKGDVSFNYICWCFPLFLIVTGENRDGREWMMTYSSDPNTKVFI